MRTMILLCVLALGGCAGLERPVAGAGGSACAATPNQQQQLSLNLAADMAREGRLHAALAHLRGLPQGLPQVRLGQARLYRLLGRSEAQELYRSLLGSCLRAAGMHGLGQLAAAGGRLEEARRQLEGAVRLEPTDARMHNDLGVVYLRLGQVEDARFEFLTALELDQADRLPARNLLTLLLYQDRWEQATELAARVGLTAAETRDAEAAAREIRDGRGGMLALAGADRKAQGRSEP
ncbi:Tetratricopeptide repeat protein [compost metagenome]